MAMKVTSLDEESLLERLAGSSLFAARFRENASRALLLTRRRPDQRRRCAVCRRRDRRSVAVAGTTGAVASALPCLRCLATRWHTAAARRLRMDAATPVQEPTESDVMLDELATLHAADLTTERDQLLSALPDTLGIEFRPML